MRITEPTPPEAISADQAWMKLSQAVCIWVVVIFIALTIIQTVVIQTLPDDWQLKESAALFGDMFGSINALASALAFALLLVTLRMQAVELKEQREQFQKMADAQTASDEKMLLQTYLNALTLESDNDVENDKPTGTHLERLNKSVLKLKFGRRAAWVRYCIEADLSQRPRPAPPHFECCERVEQHMKYWRILANYLDALAAGENSHAAAISFCRKMSPLFESDYWRSIPNSSLKEDVVSLAQQACQLRDVDELQVSGSVPETLAAALQRIQLKFPAIIKDVCFPAGLCAPPEVREARPATSEEGTAELFRKPPQSDATP